MAFRTLVQNQVNNAFNLIGDLAEDIIFANNTVNEYDFSTGTTSVNEGTSVTIRGVISRMEKDSEDNTTILTQVLIKSEDVQSVDIDNYDTIRFRNKDWSVNSIDDNGFAVTLHVARKV